MICLYNAANVYASVITIKEGYFSGTIGKNVYTNYDKYLSALFNAVPASDNTKNAVIDVLETMKK